MDSELQELLNQMLADVKDFNMEILRVSVPTKPGRLSSRRSAARTKHCIEELQEFQIATEVEDQADALIDLIYVALGGLCEMGVLPGPIFAEVHQANMKKKHGSVDKRPESSGHDAIKPDNWSPPDILRAMLRITPDVAANISPVLLEAARLRAERGRGYNHGHINIENYFPLGDASYFQMVWLKTLRLQSILEGATGDPKDSLLDLINYATFWLESLAVKELANEPPSNV